MSQILKFTVWFFKSTIVPSQPFQFLVFQQLPRCNEYASVVVRTFLTCILLTGRKVESGK
jgi:hypothetical protein